MTYVVVPDKAVGDIFTETMWDVSIKDNMNKGVLRPIGDNLLSSGAASVSFSSIAADWAHLLAILFIRMEGLVTFASANIRFNNDSGANYDWVDMANTAATTMNSIESFAQTVISMGNNNLPGASAGANLYGSVYMLIPNYANSSNHKLVTGLVGGKSGTSTGNLRATEFSGFWRSTAAINRVDFFSGSGNFTAGSRFALFAVAGI